MDDIDSLSHRAIEASARGIQMASTIEETSCHLIAGELVDRAQRHPNGLITLGIFTQRDAELQALDLQGHIDQSFGIALDEVELVQVVAIQRVVSSMALSVDHQTIAQYMAHEAQTVLAVVMVDVAVDLILVDVLGEQLADDEEDIWVVGIEGEASRIGHHATIDGNGIVLTQTIEESQLPNNTEHEFAG